MRCLVVSLTLTNRDVRHVLIDNESYVNILFYDAFSRMNLLRDHLQKTSSLLIGFSRDTIPHRRHGCPNCNRRSSPKTSNDHAKLPGDESPFIQHIILGRPGLNALDAIVFTYHLPMKFLTSEEWEKSETTKPWPNNII